MEVERLKCGPFSPLQHGHALSAARGARSNSRAIRSGRRSPTPLLPLTPIRCAHPSCSAVRLAFLRDCPARRPRGTATRRPQGPGECPPTVAMIHPYPPASSTVDH
eukprot:1780043-Prymnesium_polylepis.1